MTRRKNGKVPLEDTRELLAATNSQIEDLRRRRADELRGAADDGELDKLDAEIKRLELLARRHSERIALLEAAAAEAEAQRRVKEKESLIQRIEKKVCDDRRAAAGQIADGIAKADAGLRKLLDIARDAMAAWPWQAHDLAPTLLAPSAIVAAIQHELYRVGARPLLGGGVDKWGAGINFPGGKSPRLELAGLPGKIQPLVDVMVEASELASQIMRTGKSTADVPASATAIEQPPNAESKRTPAQERLSTLLNRQAELADKSVNDPVAEAEYHEVVAQLSLAQAEVEAERART